MDPISIIGIVLGALGVIGSGYQVALNEYAPDAQRGIRKLIKEVQAKISQNSALAEKLAIAYNQKNNSYLSSLMNGMGFGPRINAIVAAINSNDKDYKDATDKINQTNANLTKIQNELDYANQNAGSSIRGAIKADEIAKQAKKDLEKVNVSQNIDGGITTQ